MILRLRLDLPEDAVHVAVVRHVCRCLLERLQVEEADITDLEFVVGELATNAVRHAKDHGYRIKLEFFARRAVVTVVDKGQGFSFAQVPPPGTPRPDEETGEERLGGWGLPMVELLSDRVQFFRTDERGTTVRAEKRLRYQSHEAAKKAKEMEAAPAEVGIE